MVSLKADLSEIIGGGSLHFRLQGDDIVHRSGTLGGIALANQANLGPTTQKMAT